MYNAHVHFLRNLDLFCIDNARVIYRKIRYKPELVKFSKFFFNIITLNSFTVSQTFSHLFPKAGQVLKPVTSDR